MPLSNAVGRHHVRSAPRLLTVLALLFTYAALSVVRAQAAKNARWQRLGPEGGDVISLAAAPDGSVYLGTPDGHVFASKDGGVHWELRGRAGTRFDGVVQRLLVDVRDPRRLWAAIWYQDRSAGGGIWRSDDAGEHWLPTGLPGEAVRALEQAKTQPEMFVAGTGTGVFRSTDDGHTWSRISPEGDPELRNLDSLAIDPRNAAVIYAGTYHLPWKTVNGGKSWSSIAAGMIDDSDVMALRVDSEDPERLYASACSGIYRSENGGAQWTKLQGIPYAARRTQDIVQDPADPRVLYAGTTEGLWVTRDSGETWTRDTPRSWVVNAVAVVRGKGGMRLLLGTNARGVLASDGNATQFAATNAGFAHRIMAQFVADPRQTARFVARIDGLPQVWQETRDGGRSWTPLPDTARGRRITKVFGTAAGWFAATESGGLARFNETTERWTAVAFAATARPAAPGKATLHSPAAGARDTAVEVRDVSTAGLHLYVATQRGIWIGDSGGSLLRPLTQDHTTQRDLHGLAVGPDGREVWTITSDLCLYSADGGKTWRSEALPPLSDALLWVRTIENSDEVRVLLGTTRGVYGRNRSGSWEVLGAGLPAAAGELPSVGKGQIAIAIPNVGLFVSKDGARSWERVDAANPGGFLLGVAPDGADGWFAASRSEGLLYWRSSTPTRDEATRSGTGRP